MAKTKRKPGKVKTALKKKVSSRALKKSAPKKVKAKIMVKKKVGATNKELRKPLKKKVSTLKKKVVALKIKKHAKLKTKTAGKIVKATILKSKLPEKRGRIDIKKDGIVTLKKTNGLAPLKAEKVKKFKPNKKVKYTRAELKYFRDVIMRERKMIFESAKANMDALVDKESGEYKGDDLTYSSHMAEQGTDEMEREKNYLFVQRDEKYLGYLQEALTRIDQGTYGICIDCRDDPKNLCKSCPLIAKERLELVPITQHCIECKNLRG